MVVKPSILHHLSGSEPENLRHDRRCMVSSNRVCQMVRYTLNEHDVQRADQLVPRLNASAEQNLNKPHVGDEYPALILRDFGGSANLKVFLDGGAGAELWVTSRAEGAGEGKWVRTQ
jgi:hypothetical protein